MPGTSSDPSSLPPFAFEDSDSGPAETPRALPRPSRLLGMTPQQRFILSVLVLLSVCALGSMCLLITGRIGI